MADRTHGITRRQLLGGVGAVGVASAGAALGTTAYFSDEESFENNSFAAGELDLLLDYKVSYHGGPGRLEDIRAMGYEDAEEQEDGHYLLESVPDVDDEDWDEYVLKNGFCSEGVRDELLNGDEVAPIRLEDVKPGDSGCLTTSLHLCDNPGYLWMNGELVADDDNGLTEPEAEVDDTGGDGEGELADAIQARLWYDENCDCEWDQEEGEGNEADVLLVLDRSGSMSDSIGAMRQAAKDLVEELGDNANVGLVSYSNSASLDQELTDNHADVNTAIDGLGAGGRTHIGDGVQTAHDELRNGTNARSGAKKFMVVMSDGEHNQGSPYPIDAAEDAKDDDIELFTVAFGDANETTLQDMSTDPWEVHFFDTGDENELIDAFGEIGRIIAGEREIFSGTLAEVLDVLGTDDGVALDGNRETDYVEVEGGEPADGDDDGREPFDPGRTHCIGLTWELPTEVGNEVQSDSVTFDVGFYAEQARHNDGAGPSAAD